MRILHVIHQYFPDHVGGTEHYTLLLALAQRQAGHEVAILSRRYDSGQRLDREVQDGIPLYLAVNGPFTPARRFRSTLGDRFLTGCLTRVALETEPNLVHVQHLMGLPASALLAINPSVPMVVTLHDYWWVCANAQLFTDYSEQVCAGPSWWLNCARCGLARVGIGAAWPLAPLAAPAFAWRAAALRRLVPRVAAWIAPTRFVGNWYIEHGLPSERMHIVGHGIELPPSAGEKPTHEPKDERAHHFAYIGGLSKQKGIHVLIDAFNELPPDAQLTIAGDETAFPEYCTNLRRRSKHPGIRFAGRLDRDGVWQTLAATDAIVVPSLWYETASLVAQEAFATGTPVIAANHGALAERVQHEVDGLLVPPGDADALRRALRRFIEEPDLAARLGSGIRPVVTIAGHASKIESIYQRLSDVGRDTRIQL